MRTLSLFLIGSLHFANLAAAEVMIFDTRKNLRMADSEPVYHDYYINGGTEVGLSGGMVLTVTRRLPLYDTYQNRSAGDLQLKVAKIKIIHAQKGLAVARLLSEFSRENAPLLEDNFIMVGDLLDLSSATSGEGSGKRSGSAAAEKEAEESAAASSAPASRSEKPVAQITVNAVELSSQAPAAAKPSAGVETPRLQ